MSAARPKRWRDLLAPADLLLIDRSLGRLASDPGRKTRQELAAMSTAEREKYKQARIRFHGQMPALHFASRGALYRHLETEREDNEFAGPERSDAHPVTLLDGLPGVGKSRLMKDEVARTLRLAAETRLQNIHDGVILPDPAPTRRYTPTWRPAIMIESTAGNTVPDIRAKILENLGWPYGRNPHTQLTRAITESGTTFIAFDEVQRGNFDRKTGQHLHGLFRELSENHSRLLLAGTDARWMLANPKHFGSTFGTDGSADRWVVKQIEPLGYSSPAERSEWKSLLRAIEDRVRLAAAPPTGWLHVDLADYLHAVTEGRLNVLTWLIRAGLGRAIRDGSECLTRAILEDIPVPPTLTSGRDARVGLAAS